MRVSESYNLKILYPEIAREWDHNKNGINPEDVLPKSGKKIWWICDEGHSWPAAVKDRHKHGCPYCNGQLPTEKNNLIYANPTFLKEWNYKKNDKCPNQYCPKSCKEVWWICEKGHEWEATIVNRYENSCPYCSGRYASSENNLTNFPKLLEEWDYEKNEIKPESLTPHSHKIVYWKCKKGHSWPASIKSRHIGGCPYCSGRLATEENNLTLNKELMLEWNPKNKIKPEEITLGSQKIVWWKCKNNHEWKQSPNARRNNKPCPFCSKKRPSKEYNLQTERPEIAKMWHPINNGNLRPIDVLPSSNKRVWWKCKCGNEFFKKVSRCRIRCTKCSRKVSCASNKWLDKKNIKNREYFINIGGRGFFVDGFKDNIVYEFLGNYWHGNPILYHPKKKNATTKSSFGDLLFNTIERLNALSQHYKIIYKWEHSNEDKVYCPIKCSKDKIIKKATLLYKSDFDVFTILEKEGINDQ